jgi:hypothetical protein
MGSFCLMGTEFQFYKMKRVPEVGDGDSCTTMWKYFNCALWSTHVKVARTKMESLMSNSNKTVLGEAVEKKEPSCIYAYIGI